MWTPKRKSEITNRNLNVCKYGITMNTMQSFSNYKVLDELVFCVTINDINITSSTLIDTMPCICIVRISNYIGNNKSCPFLPHSESTYDTVLPKEAPAISDHVTMETNPAYRACSCKQ